MSDDSAPRHAAALLAPCVYDELKAIARGYMRREHGYNTLQPTALVHEAYLRMLDMKRIDWQGKTHFLAIAATQMRRILVERARSAQTRKRGGGAQRITLRDDVALTPARSVNLLALDQALDNLGRHSPRQVRVAELRLFAGASILEIAELLGVTDRTIKKDWRMARAWLARELSSSHGGGS